MRGAPSILLAAVVLSGLVLPVHAQDEEEAGEAGATLNGHIKVQTGVFVPLASDGFSPQKEEAWVLDTNDNRVSPCNPIETPTRPCYPINHGKKPGSLSMGRATLQLEGDWIATEEASFHAIVQGVRSLELPADRYAQVPVPAADPADRAAFAKEWAHDNNYEQFELREIYLDLFATDWLSFRLGRQQVAWGETGQYRLLDVINPEDTSWHFGPLESFEDTRVPLWMAKGLIEFQKSDQSLEIVWVPLIDDPEDTVTRPLTFVGAWGLPYPNTPSPFEVREKLFLYPGGDPNDMRAGARWKGTIGNNAGYSLAYYYTHQLSPPVPTYFDQTPIAGGGFDATQLDRLVLEFPRQHIVGGSFEYTIESPIGMVAKLETAVEPDRTYPLRSDVSSATGGMHADPDVAGRFHFEPKEEVAVNYAVVLMRPTMIRFLNPTQNFLLVAQFMHTIVPTLDENEDWALIEIPGFNDSAVHVHSYRFILAMLTNYAHGMISPKLVAAFIPPASGFYSLGVGLRFGPHWRMNVAATDFFGSDPYSGVGLFRDRDEINLSVLAQF